MNVTAKELCQIYGVDRRTVSNWLRMDPPCPSTMHHDERRFDTAEVARWREKRAVSNALKKSGHGAPQEIDEAKRRKAVADAQLAEIEVDEKEGKLVPVEVLEGVVGEMCDRLRAVAINMPSNYGIQLEQAGVPAKDAQHALEAIADDIIRAMRAAGDEMERENDVDSDD